MNHYDFNFNITHSHLIKCLSVKYSIVQLYKVVYMIDKCLYYILGTSDTFPDATGNYHFQSNESWISGAAGCSCWRYTQLWKCADGAWAGIINIPLGLSELLGEKGLCLSLQM